MERSHCGYWHLRELAQVVQHCPVIHVKIVRESILEMHHVLDMGTGVDDGVQIIDVDVG